MIEIEEVSVSGMEDNPSSSSPFTPQALDVHVVVENIISHLGDNPHDLMKFRLVGHKWNEIITRRINKSSPSFTIPLRYGPQVPKVIVKSHDAKRWAGEVLENVGNTLTGSAARILFDTVVVDNDFYLTGINPEWAHFLEIQGKSIRHLKFEIRTGESNKVSENIVQLCPWRTSEQISPQPRIWNLYITVSDFPEPELPNHSENGCFLGMKFLSSRN